MQDVTVEMDGMELIGSQFIHASSSRLEVGFQGAKMIVKFVADGGDNRWEIGPEDGCLSLTLYNFKSRVGVGRLKPVLAGKNDDASLYLTFIVETLSAENNERIISFNFFKRPL